MKYIALIIIGILTQVGFSQSVHTVIEAAESVDTALLIVGGNRVALGISNIDQPVGRGINVIANGTGLSALSLGGNAVYGHAQGPNASGVFGRSDLGNAVYGHAQGPNASGVHGLSDLGNGVHGRTLSSSSNDAGVSGFAWLATGVYGESNNSYGVQGRTNSFSPTIAGVRGFSTHASGVSGESANSYGVQGQSTQSTGVFGSSENGSGVRGTSLSSSSNDAGVRGFAANTNGVIGESNNSYGVYGQTNSSSLGGAGVRGFSINARGVSGESTNLTGVSGQSSQGYGVFGHSEYLAGVRGVSDNGTGVNSYSVHGVGLVAGSFNDIAATFESLDPGTPDIMFPRTTGTAGQSDARGIISSDPDAPGSSLLLRSNDDITLVVDRDNSANTGSFQITNSNGVSLMHVHEINGTDIRGNIEMKSVGSNDNGLILSDRTGSSSDLIIDANDDIVLQLDNNNDEGGELRVESGSDVVIFRLYESGNLNIAGSLNQGSDRNRKHSIKTIDENVILDQINTLPVYSWKYNGQDSITHVGPMAQHFYAQFGLGQGETTISSIDADGINLAGIKALYQKNMKLTTEVAALKEAITHIYTLLAQRKNN